MKDDPATLLWASGDGGGEHRATTVPPPHIPSVVVNNDLTSTNHITPSMLLPSLGYSIPAAPGCFIPTSGTALARVGGIWSHLAHPSISLSSFAGLPTPADMIPIASPMESFDDDHHKPLDLLSQRVEGHRRSQSDIIPLGFLQHQNLQLPPLLATATPTVKLEDSMIEGRRHPSEDAAGATLDDLVNSCMNSNGLGILSSTTQPWHEHEHDDDQHLGSCQVLGPPPLAWSAANSYSPGHFRSLSVDDSLMGNLNSGAMDSIPPPLQSTAADGGSARGNGSISIGSVEFSESEKNKIMANEYLSHLVLTDPKRVKRILNNRISAARSKERKVRYMVELERKVQELQMKTSTLFAQVTTAKMGYNEFANENKELKTRMEAMVKRAKVMDVASSGVSGVRFLESVSGGSAVNKSLSAEIHRIKAHECLHQYSSDPHVPTGSHQQMMSSLQLMKKIQLEQLLLQKQQLQE
ncbi:hypothetical protein GUJ93_ZPchr0002g26019 [Zizania palustris]|uniref:BZIP domain-containing protein n=1 Tax=Zizania palustris TaxID=103762 RepID=A0A8J5VAB2_ZIZPA|nr:hypothetical protein GUJ93_ZPchr0002g26019 [Zizania palustris]